MKYRNLDLEAFDYHRAGDVERFHVRVAASPAGEQRVSDAEEVGLSLDLRRRLRLLEQRRLPLPEMIRLGEELAAALFPPRARTFLERGLPRLKDDEGLRIRLKLDTYALADLPWEYAYVARSDTPPDQKGTEGFLVLNRRISLVRYEVLGEAPGTLDPVGTTPLRMVALLANPADPGYPPLKLGAEKESIGTALADVPGIQVEFYDDATVEKLQDALAREVHVFHFAGHGQFEGDMGTAYGSLEGAGSIVLLGDDRRAAPFPAKLLALNLAARGVRLAVLGACEGGRRDGQNAWTGVTPALMRAGIPAAVGMQDTIRDDNAIAFSRQFYTALAEGEPVDAAVTDGRLAILNRGGDDERDWGVPVLYLRAEEGVLFPRAVKPPSDLVLLVRRSYALVKTYFALLALFGLSIPQLLNIRPTEYSLFSFLVFTVLAVVFTGLGAVMLIELRRKGNAALQSGENRRTRRIALAALILTPLAYFLLLRFFQIPNTWPILVEAGAESREMNVWIKTITGRTLAGLDEEAGRLFNPRRPFIVGRAVHRVTISNRSWVLSPPLELHLTLQMPPGLTSPPAMFILAVASPAMHEWHPLWRLFRTLPAKPTWVPYKHSCADTRIETGWCFIDPPDDRSNWFEPEIRLRPVSARSSVEVYFELAFREDTPVQMLPATLMLRQAAKGEFPVDLRLDVDLNAGSLRR